MRLHILFRLTVLFSVFAALCGGSHNANALDVKLADIVGGGDGSGTGTVGNGINPLNGSTAPPAQTQVTQPDNSNSYHPTVLRFVDGVFIPDGGASFTTLDSAGHSFAGFPNTDGTTWDLAKDGPNVTSGSVLGGVNYNSGSHSMIGLHASKGLTFDLTAIRAAHPGLTQASFTAVAGLTELVGPYGASDWWVFVDGNLVAQMQNAVGGVGTPLNISLAPTAHFLTLVSTDHSDGNHNDEVMFGDPVLHLSVPEPSTLALAALGCLGLLVLNRRRR